MKFIIIKIIDSEIDEIILNLDFINSVKKEKKYEEQELYNFVEIPNEFNYFVRLKNEDQFKISFEEYEKIKKEIL